MGNGCIPDASSTLGSRATVGIVWHAVHIQWLGNECMERTSMHEGFFGPDTAISLQLLAAPHQHIGQSHVWVRGSQSHMHDPLPEGIRVQSSGLGLADKLLMLVRD